MTLFDVPLHYRFRDASLAGNSYDMRTIFDDGSGAAITATIAVTNVRRSITRSPDPPAAAARAGS